MTELVLVGAGGLAREAMTVVQRLGVHDTVVVLDDDPSTWGRRVGGTAVSGAVDAITQHPDAEVVVCLGTGVARRRVVQRLTTLGVQQDRYTSLVHPTAEVPDGCSVLPGSIVLACVVLTADVVIGRHAVLMPHVTVTHDGHVGDFATLCAGVALGGSVVVGAGAYLGMRASVRERITLGVGCTLGMGSVAVSDVPAGERWVGVPARPLARPPARRRAAAVMGR